jgi:hypothetical protein
VLLGILSFSGCSTKVEYVDRVSKVYVNVPCKVKEVKCDINGTDSEVVLGMAKCIITLKKEAKVCQE